MNFGRLRTSTTGKLHGHWANCLLGRTARRKPKLNLAARFDELAVHHPCRKGRLPSQEFMAAVRLSLRDPRYKAADRGGGPVRTCCIRSFQDGGEMLCSSPSPATWLSFMPISNNVAHTQGFPPAFRYSEHQSFANLAEQLAFPCLVAQISRTLFLEVRIGPF